MPFTVFALLFAAAAGVAACLFGWVSPRRQRLSATLPRHRIIGVVLAVVCLIWAAYHVHLMLEGPLTKYRGLLKFAVPVIAFLSYRYLDFLFSRALGGLILLAVNSLLLQAFAIHLPLRQAFSLVAYGFAVFGMLLIAYPWWLRDLLEKAHSSSRWRHALVGIMAGAGVIIAGFAVAGMR